MASRCLGLVRDLIAGLEKDMDAMFSLFPFALDVR